MPYRVPAIVPHESHGPFRDGMPFGLLRSEPAADRFKAAVAPRRGRSRRPAPSRAAGFARAFAPLSRRSARLVLPSPDLEAFVFRRFGMPAPKGKPARGRNRFGIERK